MNNQNSVTIIDDHTGIGAVLAQKLMAMNYLVHLDDELVDNSNILIDLTGLKSIDQDEEAIRQCKQAFLRAKQFGMIDKKDKIYMTVEQLDGHFGLKKVPRKNALLGSLAALTKTAAKEWPAVQCKALDIADFKDVEQAAAIIVSELLGDFKHIEIGWSPESGRISPELKQINETPPSIKAIDSINGAILVPGGARGITSKCILALARKVPARYVLFGRTQLIDESETTRGIVDQNLLKQAIIQSEKLQNERVTPREIVTKLNQILSNREIKNTLEEFKKIGVQAEYLSLDINNDQEVIHRIDELRQRYQNIDGIIHGAGVLADKLIADKTVAQFDNVFDTKLKGFLNLMQATAQDELKLIVIFSSVSARFGNPGQVDYAMANEALNKLAQWEKQTRGDQCIVKAINWGPWEGGMVNESLKNEFAKRGIKLIPVQAGADAFVKEILQHDPYVEMVIGSEFESIVSDSPDSPKKQILNLSLQQYPYLNSHRINQNIVLPSMQVLAWMHEFLRRLYHDPKRLVIEHFKVLKGVLIEPEKNYSFCLELLDKKINNHLLLVFNSDNRTHYSAEFNPDFDIDQRSDFSSRINTSERLWVNTPMNLEHPYTSSELFHGEDLQVIKRYMLSDNGGMGFLDAKNKLASPEVALCDGVLQLIRLWGCQKLHQFTLPTSIKEVVFYSSPSVGNELEAYCEFDSVIVNQLKTVSSARLWSAKKELLLELNHIEMYVVNF